MVIGLVLYALRQNISLFYSPSQISEGQAPINQHIRVGGMVEKGSLKRNQKSLDVVFIITDFNKKLTIHYQGILPDLFREGQGIVAEGVLTGNQQFNASEVLAKHDEKYMPPQVEQTLQKRPKG